MDFLSGLAYGFAIALGFVLCLATRYRKQRNDARSELDYWQKRACRHEAMVNALATIPKTQVRYYSHTWSNN